MDTSNRFSALVNEDMVDFEAASATVDELNAKLTDAMQQSASTCLLRIGVSVTPPALDTVSHAAARRRQKLCKT